MHAGPGEVRIRVHAAAVNPTDILARDGSRAEQQKVDPLSYVPGMDVAGIVDEVGSDVQTGVRIGDAVMGTALPKRSHGAYREQIVLGARSVARAPAGTSHVEACTLPMNGLTARQSLDLLNLAPGQVLAVTGAAGAYGGYVIQQARRDGLTVIADASDADRELVESLGAHVVVARGPDMASRIREHFPSGVDGLADGAVLNERAIPAVRDGGAFTAVRGFQGAPQRGIRFSTTFVRTYDGQFEKLDRLRQLVEAGTITLRVAATYPRERAADAHHRLEARGTRGRLEAVSVAAGPWSAGVRLVYVLEALRARHGWPSRATRPWTSPHPESQPAAYLASTGSHLQADLTLTGGQSLHSRCPSESPGTVS